MEKIILHFSTNHQMPMSGIGANSNHGGNKKKEKQLSKTIV